MRSTEKYRYTYVTFELLDPIGSAPRGLGRNAAP
jgi:hypothetical protein